MSRTTLKDIAAQAGVSVATVSMALKGHRRISSATRERIQALAEQMDYHPDAALSALARYRSEKKSGSTSWETLGLVDNWWEPGAWVRRSPNYQRIRDRLRKVCQQHGFTLEERWIGDAKPGQEHPVFKEWDHRGVRGIFFAPPPDTQEPQPIIVEKKNFQIITFGPVWLYPEHHSVQTDYLECFRRAWDELWQRGYRRIGLHIPDYISWRTGHAWTSLYNYKEDALPDARLKIPVLKQKPDENGRELIDWYHIWKPDAIISHCDWAHKILSQEGIPAPEKIGQVSLATYPGSISGMEPDSRAIAVSAFNLMRTFLHDSIMTDEQDIPLNVYVPSRWRDEDTLRKTHKLTV